MLLALANGVYVVLNDIAISDIFEIQNCYIVTFMHKNLE